jgi:lambda family phage portal protein
MVKHPFINKVYGLIYGRPASPEFAAGGAPDAVSTHAAPVRAQWHNGEKYPGGFGYTELLVADYWTLRQRSTQLFKTNLYARGIIRRLVTNIINTGLALEAMPDDSILGIGEDQLADWSETVENRFHLWERSPQLCDYKACASFGKLQAEAKQAALISGDVLVVLIQDALTGLPRVRLVDGDRVQSPFGAASELPKLAPGHCIKHGVELDADGRHVAYWVTQTDERQPYQLKSVRLPCYGATGRKMAWLVYGSDKLLDEVRGEPILSILLQSLREVDRYRDAVQRKAAINAILAMFIKKDTEQMGSRPLMGGAQLRGQQTITSPGKTPRVYNFAEQIPGAVLDELAPGETPHGFSSTGTDEKFADFESAIVYAMAWCLNIPPEILTLSFASNYSASQAAVNEFKLYLNPVRAAWGDEFCQPIYIDWLLSETLAGRVKAAGLLDAWRDPMQYDRLAAWLLADWTGAIKPSVDLMKQANGYEKLVEQGFITRDRATRETTGTKFSKNVKQLERENKALAEANKPIAELKKPPAPPPALPGAGPPGPKAPKDPNAPRKLRVVPKQESSADDPLVT